jgi:glycosyltransferase involved in cell wall biosynthesis
MQKKIKVMFYISTLNIGGAEKVTVTLMRQLNQEIFDIYLVLVTEEGALLDEVPAGVNIINLDIKRTLFSMIPLRKVIEEVQPDIVYSTLFRTHIAIDLALIGLSNKPKTVYMSPTSPKTLLERNELSSWMKFLISKAYKNADMVLSQTPEMKEEIAEIHGVPREKIVVFFNPIDTDLIDENIKDCENPFDSKRINIVGAGRVSEVKGFDVLIHALKKVLEVNDNFALNIVGRDAGDEQNLKDLAKELGISDRVTLWGYQDNLFKFFYHSDLFVLSSRREGLANVVLENMYLNKPIVATKCVPYYKELLEEKALVPVEDVDALVEAILGYKELDIENYSYMEKVPDINKLFIEVVGE